MYVQSIHITVVGIPKQVQWAFFAPRLVATAIAAADRARFPFPTTLVNRIQIAC